MTWSLGLYFLATFVEFPFDFFESIQNTLKCPICTLNHLIDESLLHIISSSVIFTTPMSKGVKLRISKFIAFDMVYFIFQSMGYHQLYTNFIVRVSDVVFEFSYFCSTCFSLRHEVHLSRWSGGYIWVHKPHPCSLKQDSLISLHNWTRSDHSLLLLSLYR